MTTPELWSRVRELLNPADLPGIGPEQRGTALARATIDPHVAEWAREFELPKAVGDLFRAGLYLWHDHLDAAHSIAQEIENPDGSLLHGIMHRREMDYSNAKYWFRRVGPHPAFLGLSLKAVELLRKQGETDLLTRLVPNKMWDPYAFVDACEDATRGKFPARMAALQQVQAAEFEAFFESLTNRV